MIGFAGKVKQSFPSDDIGLSREEAWPPLQERVTGGLAASLPAFLPCTHLPTEYLPASQPALASRLLSLLRVLRPPPDSWNLGQLLEFYTEGQLGSWLIWEYQIS